MPASESPAGQIVTVNLAGVVNTFTVNKNGQGKSHSGSTLTFKIPKHFSGGDIQYTLALKKQTLRTNFQAAGISTLPQFGLGLAISYGGKTTSALSSRDSSFEAFIFLLIFIYLEDEDLFWDLLFSP